MAWTSPQDHTAAVITAEQNVRSIHRGEPAPRLPETALLFYMSSGVEYLCERFACPLLTPKLPRFLQGAPVYALGGNICFMDGGRGAPQAVDTLETIAALGVRRVLTCGMFGAFDERVQIGDLVVPERVYVEEGTSLHYYESLDYAVSDAEMADALRTRLNAQPWPIVTTDAVYRQTFFKEACWRAAGAVGVDMETPALLSVGRYLGVRTASVLIASDMHPTHPGAPQWAWKMTKALRCDLFAKVTEAVLAMEKKGWQ